MVIGLDDDVSTEMGGPWMGAAMVFDDPDGCAAGNEISWAVPDLWSQILHVKPLHHDSGMNVAAQMEIEA